MRRFQNQMRPTKAKQAEAVLNKSLLFSVAVLVTFTELCLRMRKKAIICLPIMLSYIQKKTNCDNAPVHSATFTNTAFYWDTINTTL